MPHSPSVQQVVVAALGQLGIPAPSHLIRTLALQDGRLVAEKFRYDGGYAVWSVGSNAVEFYDDAGTLLKTLVTEEEKHTAA